MAPEGSSTNLNWSLGRDPGSLFIILNPFPNFLLELHGFFLSLFKQVQNAGDSWYPPLRWLKSSTSRYVVYLTTCKIPPFRWCEIKIETSSSFWQLAVTVRDSRDLCRRCGIEELGCWPLVLFRTTWGTTQPSTSHWLTQKISLGINQLQVA